MRRLEFLSHVIQTVQLDTLFYSLETGTILYSCQHFLDGGQNIRMASHAAIWLLDSIGPFPVQISPVDMTKIFCWLTQMAGIFASHESCSTWCRQRWNVIIIEDNSLFSQTIQRRCWNLIWTMKTNIIPSLERRKTK